MEEIAWELQTLPITIDIVSRCLQFFFFGKQTANDCADIVTKHQKMSYISSRILNQPFRASQPDYQFTQFFYRWPYTYTNIFRLYILKIKRIFRLMHVIPSYLLTYLIKVRFRSFSISTQVYKVNTYRTKNEHTML